MFNVPWHHAIASTSQTTSRTRTIDLRLKHMTIDLRSQLCARGSSRAALRHRWQHALLRPLVLRLIGGRANHHRMPATGTVDKGHVALPSLRPPAPAEREAAQVRSDLCWAGMPMCLYITAYTSLPVYILARLGKRCSEATGAQVSYTSSSRTPHNASNTGDSLQSSASLEAFQLDSLDRGASCSRNVLRHQEDRCQEDASDGRRMILRSIRDSHTLTMPCRQFGCR